VTPSTVTPWPALGGFQNNVSGYVGPLRLSTHEVEINLTTKGSPSHVKVTWRTSTQDTRPNGSSCIFEYPQASEKSSATLYDTPTPGNNYLYVDFSGPGSWNMIVRQQP
jgi:hypothetical protein